MLSLNRVAIRKGCCLVLKQARQELSNYCLLSWLFGLMLSPATWSMTGITCDRQELWTSSGQSRFLLVPGQEHDNLKQWREAIPGTQPRSQTFPLLHHGLLICLDEDKETLLVLQQSRHTGSLLLTALDYRTGTEQPVRTRGRLWLSPDSRSWSSEQMGASPEPVSLIQLNNGELWLGGRTPEPFLIKISAPAPALVSTNVTTRTRRQAQGEMNNGCLTTSNITDAVNVCLGLGTQCGTNNGQQIQFFVNNYVLTQVQSNIQSLITTSITTRLNSEINAVTDIQTQLDTNITAYFELDTELTLRNRISTGLNAEVATIKAQLQGNFDIENRVATLDAVLEVDAEIENDLELQVGQINLALQAEVETNLVLQAELAGARVEANSLAFMGAGTGGGIGFLVAVVGSALLYNRIRTGKWWCW